MTLIQRLLFSLLFSVSLAARSQSAQDATSQNPAQTENFSQAPQYAQTQDNASCPHHGRSSDGKTQGHVCAHHGAGHQRHHSNDAQHRRHEPHERAISSEPANDPALRDAFLRDIGYLRFGLIWSYAQKNNFDGLSNQAAISAQAVPLTLLQDNGSNGRLVNAWGADVILRPASHTRQAVLSCAKDCMAARIITLIPTSICAELSRTLNEGFSAIEVNGVFFNQEEFSLEAATQACATGRPKAVIQLIRRL